VQSFNVDILKISKESPTLATFFHDKYSVLTLSNNGLGCVLGIFSQNHLVTLLGKKTVAPDTPCVHPHLHRVVHGLRGSLDERELVLQLLVLGSIQ
jgi:hypothetical protein